MAGNGCFIIPPSVSLTCSSEATGIREEVFGDRLAKTSDSIPCFNTALLQLM
jgi:hypothetical protein